MMMVMLGMAATLLSSWLISVISNVIIIVVSLIIKESMKMINVIMIIGNDITNMMNILNMTLLTHHHYGIRAGKLGGNC